MHTRIHRVFSEVHCEGISASLQQPRQSTLMSAWSGVREGGREGEGGRRREGGREKEGGRTGGREKEGGRTGGRRGRRGRQGQRRIEGGGREREQKEREKGKI